MKRYLLFTYYNYYPSGGWFDFRADADTKEELVKLYLEKYSDYDNFDIVDTTTKEVVVNKI